MDNFSYTTTNPPSSSSAPTTAEDLFMSLTAAVSATTSICDLPDTWAPGEHEIIIGRGKKVFDHAGNAKLRGLVKPHLEGYALAKNRAAKTAIISTIYKQIRADSSIGFVKKRSGSKRNSYYKVEETTAKTAIAQCFRDFLADGYKSSKKYKQKMRDEEKAQAEAAVCDTVVSTTTIGGSSSTTSSLSSDSMTTTTKAHHNGGENYHKMTPETTSCGRRGYHHRFSLSQAIAEPLEPAQVLSFSNRAPLPPLAFHGSTMDRSSTNGPTPEDMRNVLNEASNLMMDDSLGDDFYVGPSTNFFSRHNSVGPSSSNFGPSSAAGAGAPWPSTGGTSEESNLYTSLLQAYGNGNTNGNGIGSNVGAEESITAPVLDLASNPFEPVPIVETPSYQQGQVHQHHRRHHAHQLQQQHPSFPAMMHPNESLNWGSSASLASVWSTAPEVDTNASWTHSTNHNNKGLQGGSASPLSVDPATYSECRARAA